MTFNHFINSLWVIICEMSPYILLGFLIAGMLHVFVDQKTMSRHLSGKGWKPVVKAALFGIPLPLCSCGVLPTAVALRRRGASKGATTSFLIATPQTGVDSIAATYSLLGLPFAILRPVAALAGAVAGGLAVSATDKETTQSKSICEDTDTTPQTHGFLPKIGEAIRYGLIDMVASVGPWLVSGLIIAALITVFVPDTLFISLNKYPILAMLAVVAVAVPMYVCATGSIPIALSLMMKGLSPGVAFVLLMAGPAANFASLMILHKTQGLRATAIYVGSVVITSMAFGLIIDTLLPSSWFTLSSTAAISGSCHTETALFPTLCSILLGILITYTMINRKFHNHNHSLTMTKSYKIKGMACSHCKNNVEKTLMRLEGVESVEVILDKSIAVVAGNVDDSAVKNAVELAVYEYLGVENS